MSPEFRPIHRKEQPTEHTLRVYRAGKTDRITIEVDGHRHAANEIKAKILLTLSRGPSTRTEYLTKVIGKPYDETTVAERKAVGVAQKDLSYGFFLDFPPATLFLVSIGEVKYEAPKGVNIIIEDGVF